MNTPLTTICAIVAALLMGFASACTSGGDESEGPLVPVVSIAAVTNDSVTLRIQGQQNLDATTVLTVIAYWAVGITCPNMSEFGCLASFSSIATVERTFRVTQDDFSETLEFDIPPLTYSIDERYSIRYEPVRVPVLEIVVDTRHGRTNDNGVVPIARGYSSNGGELAEIGYEADFFKSDNIDGTSYTRANDDFLENMLDGLCYAMTQTPPETACSIVPPSYYQPTEDCECEP